MLETKSFLLSAFRFKFLFVNLPKLRDIVLLC